MNVGIRVVRGPSWNWEDQDGGCVGTVIRPFDSSFNIVQSGTVFVQWDDGTVGNYRVGKDDEFDLRIFDSGPAGVKFPTVTCNECRQNGIIGTRWQCTVCDDYDLCHTCYHGDKHDLAHPVRRFDCTSSSKGIEVPPRSNSERTDVFGIFPGAEVLRCVDDWLLGQNDGGMGGIAGTVLEDPSSMTVSGRRGSVLVLWQSGDTVEHHCGRGGHVAIKCLLPGVGPKCYIDHLAILEEDLIVKRLEDACDAGEDELESHLREAIGCRTVDLTQGIGDSRLLGPFRRYDKVQVNMDVDVFCALQDEEHGGWNPEMELCVGVTGVVVDVSSNVIVVLFKGLKKRWAINPEALTKMALDVGDQVRILSDEQRVRSLQKGYGGWVHKMKEDLGNSGRIQDKTDDGRILVKMKERPYVWTLNPACCNFVETDSQSGFQDNSDASDSDGDSEPTFADSLMALDPRFVRPEALVEFAAKNQPQVVKAIVQRFPHEINIRNCGKTALHMSSLKGHPEVVKVLLEAGADVTATDDEGNTPVHYAVHRRDDPRCLRIFLEHGPWANLVNFKLISVLHMAVHKGHPKCVRTLLELGCNVNTQDQRGDTALHDAVATHNNDIVACLTQCPLINYSIMNERGFNVLQLATGKGDAFAVEKIVEAAPHLVNQQKSDGFAALHIACLNDNREAAEVLITKGRANLELKNGVGHTPVMVALSQAKIAAMELLIKKGADPNAVDSSGETILHWILNLVTSVLTGQRKDLHVVDVYEAIDVTAIVTQLPSTMPCATWVGAAVFLVQHGADVYKKNNGGVAPLQLVHDQSIKDVLLDASREYSARFTQKSSLRLEQPSVAPSLSATAGLQHPSSFQNARLFKSSSSEPNGSVYAEGEVTSSAAAAAATGLPHRSSSLNSGHYQPGDSKPKTSVYSGHETSSSSSAAEAAVAAADAGLPYQSSSLEPSHLESNDSTPKTRVYSGRDISSSSPPPAAATPLPHLSSSLNSSHFNPGESKPKTSVYSGREVSLSASAAVGLAHSSSSRNPGVLKSSDSKPETSVSSRLDMSGAEENADPACLSEHSRTSSEQSSNHSENNVSRSTAAAVAAVAGDCLEAECVLCSDAAVDVRFLPCNHAVACNACCVRMKKCPRCHVTITDRVPVIK